MMFFVAEYASMVTASLLASLLFFGGWNSPFSATPLWAWTMYIPAALFLLGGILLFVDGVRYETVLGKILLPVLGLVLVGLGALFTRPGVMEFIQPLFWFLPKAGFFLFVYVWARGTLPRFRYDQLMAFGWKVLLPLSLANAVLTSLLLVLWD
jgi:NADH-quinone oxidoreductase subunit H